MNARNRSTKSWFIGQLAAECPQLLAQTPGIQQAFGVRQLPPVFDVVTVGLSGVGVAADRDAAFPSRSGHGPLSLISFGPFGPFGPFGSFGSFGSFVVRIVRFQTIVERRRDAGA